MNNVERLYTIRLTAEEVATLAEALTARAMQDRKARARLLELAEKIQEQASKGMRS
jgi:hypothetical protein